MLCPVCRLDQVIVEVEGVELDTCIRCGGVWFDAQEVHQLFGALGVPELPERLEGRLKALTLAFLGRRRRCPRCDRRMRPVEAPGPSEAVILDRCPEGHGLWFDAGELETILETEIGADEAALARVRAHLALFAGPRGRGAGAP